MVHVLTQRALKYTSIRLVRLRHRLFGRRLPPPRIYYFAYGANLNIERFYRYHMNVERVGVARLPNYRLTFSLPCEYALKGYGDITSEAGKEVWGLLFRIDPLSLFLLDTMEWALMGQYRRVRVAIETVEGTSYVAYAYQARFPRTGLFPPVGYKASILKSGRELGFPKSYLDEIEAAEARDHFDLDPTFSFLHPHRPRLASDRFREAYLWHDRLREKVCDWLRF